MGNKTLDAARAARLDEFHTRYEDALAGLEPFRDRLTDADILLDTNDGDWSAFWRVLSDRFDEWRVGRVRSVAWDPDWDTLFASDDGGGRVFERTRHGVTERRLSCAGSIDDDEVLAMAHEADLVVGNPPFSRMSDYLSDRADANLLCLGPLTAVSYKSVFPLLLSGRLHIVSGNHGSMLFSSPAAGRLNPSAVTRDGLVQVRGVVWYTTRGQCTTDPMPPRTHGGEFPGHTKTGPFRRCDARRGPWGRRMGHGVEGHHALHPSRHRLRGEIP